VVEVAGKELSDAAREEACLPAGTREE